MHRTPHNTRGFSLIELVMVVIIIAVIAAIAAPRFVDAGSGRRLNAAQKIILDDIRTIKLIARATGKPHIIKFYPNNDMYVAFEGLDINKSAIVLARTLTDEPLNLQLARTNLDTDQTVLVSPMGDLEKSFRITVSDQGIEKLMEITGVGFNREAVTETDSVLEIKTGIIDAKLGEDGLGLNLFSGGNGDND